MPYPDDPHEKEWDAFLGRWIDRGLVLMGVGLAAACVVALVRWLGPAGGA